MTAHAHQADYGDGTLVWYVIEVSFLGIFTLEIILNLFAFGRIFLEAPAASVECCREHGMVCGAWHM